MTRTLIASSGDFHTSNCGFSGVVPAGEEYYVVRDDSVWGAQGEFLVAGAGQTSTVSQCHNAGVAIGYCNGQAFHYMRIYKFADSPPDDVKTYDCLNGDCIVKTQYNTPGIYGSLANCQAVCANGGACGAGKQCIDPTTFCPDGKVCIEQDEFSSIEALISKIGSEVC
ncbi:hypothetical protein [Nostoc sp.]|uniref:hypothetical protein n=1 Tax=Nostoc sp. TaxID=1180 RepID=UPI002FF53193